MTVDPVHCQAKQPSPIVFPGMVCIRPPLVQDSGAKPSVPFVYREISNDVFSNNRENDRILTPSNCRRIIQIEKHRLSGCQVWPIVFLSEADRKFGMVCLGFLDSCQRSV